MHIDNSNAAQHLLFGAVEDLQRLKLEALVAEAVQLIRRVSV
jgi:hypothetical protein